MRRGTGRGEAANGGMATNETASSVVAGRRGRRRTRARVVLGGVAAAGLSVSALALVSADHAAGTGWHARATLRDVTGARVGTIRFDGTGHGTIVTVAVNGLTTGLDAFHGLHIHANAPGGPCDPTTSPPFTNVGAHWSPSGATHGNHEGDLPGVLVMANGTGGAASGTGRFDPSQLKGRVVILHAGPDNLANVPTRYSFGSPAVAGPDDVTLATGDSGGRLACGVIEGG